MAALRGALRWRREGEDWLLSADGTDVGRIHDGGIEVGDVSLRVERQGRRAVLVGSSGDRLLRIDTGTARGAVLATGAGRFRLMRRRGPLRSYSLHDSHDREVLRATQGPFGRVVEVREGGVLHEETIAVLVAGASLLLLDPEAVATA